MRGAAGQDRTVDARAVVRAHAAQCHRLYLDSGSRARILQQRVAELLAHPGADTLAAARRAWTSARTVYCQTEALRFYGGPIDAVEPTPFQRDLSDTHHKRLADVINKTGRFLDPIITVSAPNGGFWTPNGRHRLEAMRRLGAKSISALVVPDREIAWQILALNTENVTVPSLTVPPALVTVALSATFWLLSLNVADALPADVVVVF